MKRNRTTKILAVAMGLLLLTAACGDDDDGSTVEDPGGDDWLSQVNPNALERLQGCKLEPSLQGAAPGTRVQFERMGYFALDPVDATPTKPVWNRIVTLKDTWARIEKRG